MTSFGASQFNSQPIGLPHRVLYTKSLGFASRSIDHRVNRQQRPAHCDQQAVLFFLFFLIDEEKSLAAGATWPLVTSKLGAVAEVDLFLVCYVLPVARGSRTVDHHPRLCTLNEVIDRFSLGRRRGSLVRNGRYACRALRRLNSSETICFAE